MNIDFRCYGSSLVGGQHDVILKCSILLHVRYNIRRRNFMTIWNAREFVTIVPLNFGVT